MVFAVRLINVLSQLITLLVIAKVVLSYFMDPYNPIRQAIDRVVEPMLNPIRRIIPAVGMLDFSPFVLIILVQIIASVLTRLLLNFA